VERFFRDARAAGVVAPTTDALYDFIQLFVNAAILTGHAMSHSLLLLGAVAYDPKVVTSGTAFSSTLRAAFRSLHPVHNHERQGAHFAGQIPSPELPLAWLIGASGA
jgi:hypothetical protein